MVKSCTFHYLSDDRLAFLPLLRLSTLSWSVKWNEDVELQSSNFICWLVFCSPGLFLPLGWIAVVPHWGQIVWWHYWELWLHAILINFTLSSNAGPQMLVQPTWPSSGANYSRTARLADCFSPISNIPLHRDTKAIDINILISSRSNLIYRLS